MTDLLKPTRTRIPNRFSLRGEAVISLPLYKTLSARELFPILNRKRLDSRPVVGQDRGDFKIDKSGRKRYFNKPVPIYGDPTFRNIIENGEHI